MPPGHERRKKKAGLRRLSGLETSRCARLEAQDEVHQLFDVGIGDTG